MTVRFQHPMWGHIGYILTQCVVSMSSSCDLSASCRSEGIETTSKEMCCSGLFKTSLHQGQVNDLYTSWMLAVSSIWRVHLLSSLPFSVEKNVTCLQKTETFGFVTVLSERKSSNGVRCCTHSACKSCKCAGSRLHISGLFLKYTVVMVLNHETISMCRHCHKRCAKPIGERWDGWLSPSSQDANVAHEYNVCSWGYATQFYWCR